MKSLLMIALLSWGALAGASAQESDLVKAANAAKAKRPATTTKKPKVITNADVKKAKSQLGTTTSSTTGEQAPPPAAAKSTVPAMSPDQLFRARRDAEDRVAKNEKKVAELEKSLDLIEQAFYSENDPTYRDDVIQKRFEQTKRQLTDARKELADARDALAVLQPSQLRNPATP